MIIVREYFNDVNTVRYVLEKLSALTIGEMKALESKDRCYVSIMINEITEREGLEPCYVKHMSYPEMLTLIANTQNSPVYSSYYLNSNVMYDSSERYLTYTHLLGMFLLDTGEKSTAIRMLLAIPVIRLYEGLREFIDADCSDVAESIIKDYRMLPIASRKPERGTETVGDILKGCHEITRRAWKPGVIYLKDYENELRKAYELEARLLISSISQNHSEKTSIEAIRANYSYTPDYDDAEWWKAVEK